MVETHRDAERHTAPQHPNQEEDQGPHQIVITNEDDEQDDISSEECFENESDDDENYNDDGDLKMDCAGSDRALALAAQKPSDFKPSFGSVTVNNSADVHFGNKTFYNGPVTIKQFVYSSKNGSVDVRHGVTADTDAESESGVKTNVEDDVTPTVETPGVNGSLAPIWQPSQISDEQPSSPPEAKSVSQWIRKVIKTRRGLIAVVGASFLLLLITLVAVLVSARSKDPAQTDTPSSSSSPDEDTNTSRFQGTKLYPSGKLRILKRDEWLAQPPVHPADPLKHPVSYVIILHTATDNCTTQAKCTFFVRKTQTFHIESFGWWDIGYSFLVGGDGYAYEGRGWDGIGAFAYGYNNRSIGISFIGTFIKVLPPPRQIQAAKQLIAEGVRLGKISPNYKLLAHRQVSATESPGEMFFENIKTWDHWSESP